MNNRIIVEEEEEKVETFADSLKHQFSNNRMESRLIEQRVEQSIQEMDHNVDQDYEENKQEQPEEVGEKEIQDIIKESNKRKAPRQDKTTNAEVKNLPQQSVKNTAEITDAIIKLNHYAIRIMKSEI